MFPGGPSGHTLGFLVDLGVEPAASFPGSRQAGQPAALPAAPPCLGGGTALCRVSEEGRFLGDAPAGRGRGGRPELPGSSPRSSGSSWLGGRGPPVSNRFFLPAHVSAHVDAISPRTGELRNSLVSVLRSGVQRWPGYCSLCCCYYLVSRSSGLVPVRWWVLSIIVPATLCTAPRNAWASSSLIVYEVPWYRWVTA